MSGTTPQATPVSASTEDQQRQRIHAGYARFQHNAALALLIGAPILIAIPPRKLDLYTFSLAGAFCVSANHVTRERTGRSILQHFGGFPKSQDISSEATKTPLLLAHTRLLELNDENEATEYTTIQAKSGDAEEDKHAKDWKERRLREEQEKLDAGEGYADMIVDQIWDVWNQKKEVRSSDQVVDKEK